MISIEEKGNNSKFFNKYLDCLIIFSRYLDYRSILNNIIFWRRYKIRRKQFCIEKQKMNPSKTNQVSKIKKKTKIYIYIKRYNLEKFRSILELRICRNRIRKSFKDNRVCEVRVSVKTIGHGSAVFDSNPCVYFDRLSAELISRP